MTKKNLIILTNGLAGSSVLAGLLSRGGYWLGKETFKKHDYNTYENLQLVELNKDLFKQSKYSGKYEMVFDQKDIDHFINMRDSIDPTPFSSFIDTCNEHQPWLWKDPRLWLTIHYWKPLLNLDRIQFIVLTRDPMQTWISTTIRRQIQSPAYCKNYMESIHNSIITFLEKNQLPYLDLIYEDLITAPDDTIDKINIFTGNDLTKDDLKNVFKGTLGKKQRSLFDLIKASLIYAKNYRLRYH